MSSEIFDAVVIGGGSGGLMAVRDIKRRGLRPLLVQAGPIGGDCTFTGCIPSKTLLAAAAEGLDFCAAMDRVRSTVSSVADAEDDAALASEGIEVRHGWAHFVSPNRITLDDRPIDCERFIVATGATPAEPPITGLADTPYLTSDSIFELSVKPASLAILGGGPIGCELAQAFARLGVAVTLIEGEDRLLTKEELRASVVVTETLHRDGVTILTGVTVDAVRREADSVQLSLSNGEAANAEQLLVAVGRKPAGAGFGLEEIGVEVDKRGAVVTDDTLATRVGGIWAIGDVAGRLQLTHAASKMALVAVANATGRFARLHKQRFDAGTIPWATFTDPEVGRIGMTEAEAAAQGEAKVAELPFTEFDRAITAGRTEGFVKLIAGPRFGLGWAAGGKLLGATIVGPTGGDLINEVALAMRTRMFTGRLAQTTHVYPSWSLAIQEATAQFFFESKGRSARPARAA